MACTPKQLRTYQSKISGPIMDRIDLRGWVNPVEKEELISMNSGETSAQIRERVALWL